MGHSMTQDTPLPSYSCHLDGEMVAQFCEGWKATQGDLSRGQPSSLVLKCAPSPTEGEDMIDRTGATYNNPCPTKKGKSQQIARSHTTRWCNTAQPARLSAHSAGVTGLAPA